MQLQLNSNGFVFFFNNHITLLIEIKKVNYFTVSFHLLTELSNNNLFYLATTKKKSDF